ncbi:MAG: hypothetical protein ABIG46_00475 [Candidatus Omnitrophota bacterium]|nr:hypothetical protein [Candidatus Omnitrophota bacterium]
MSVTISYFAAYIQLTANKSVNSCSYLDPLIIDIVALIAGFFLICESLVDIFFHKQSPVVKQLVRCVRMAFGSAIVTIHILQFIHK